MLDHSSHAEIFSALEGIYEAKPDIEPTNIAKTLPETIELSDYQDGKLWKNLNENLEIAIWSVVNDGVIDIGEEKMLMSLLEIQGVPNNEHTLHMLRSYLNKEIEQYKHSYANLSEEQQQEKLVEEQKIKEGILKKLKEDEIKKKAQAQKKENIRKRDKQDKAKNRPSFLNEILDQGARDSLSETISRLREEMCLNKPSNRNNQEYEFNRAAYEQKTSSFSR